MPSEVGESYARVYTIAVLNTVLDSFVWRAYHFDFRRTSVSALGMQACFPVNVLCDLPVVFHVGQRHAFYCSIISYHREIEQLIYFCIDGAVDCLDRCYYEHHHLTYERFMHPSVLLGAIWLFLEVIGWLYSYQLCIQSSNMHIPLWGKWQKLIFFLILWHEIIVSSFNSSVFNCGRGRLHIFSCSCHLNFLV